MGVLPVHRERQLVGDGLAHEARTGVQQGLHGGRRAALNAEQRQQQGLPAAGGVAVDVEQVLDAEPQAGERAGGCARHRHGGVRHEGAGGVVQNVGVWGHGILLLV